MRPDTGPHFLIAREADAATGAESVELDGVDAVAGFQGYGLDQEALAELQCIVLGRDYDPKVLADYKEVYVWDEMRGPWLIRIPDDFVSALAIHDAQSVGSIARRWGNACDAFQANEAPASWIENLVAKLTKLARRATQQKKSMYLEVPSC
jgi:hypothetical protein